MDLSRFPELRDWASSLQSSHDRTGGNFQSFPALAGTTDTSADLTGLGAVVRLWFANPNGQPKVYFAQAADCSQFTFALSGQPVGGVYDAYHPGVVPSGPVALGCVTLPDGSSRLVVTIHGKNDAATGVLFGLDALVLKPVK